MPKEEITRMVGTPLKNEKTKVEGINHLLVIAINDYKYAPSLKNCINDVERFVKVLTEKYRFDPEYVIKIYDEEATRENILKTLSSYSEKVNKNDNLLILFSGHGEIYRGEYGYWVPVEAKPGERYQYIAHSEIKIELDNINCFHTFLVVDACFSGSIFTAHRNISPGDEGRRSRWGLAASHSREVALDGQPGENSPFSRYLIKNLEENEADIGIHKLSASVIDDVRRAVQGKQTPVFQPLDVKGHDLGQFVFRLRGQNTFVDPRDGKVYRTIEVNGKLWMAQNLDYDVGEDCWYFADDPRIGQVFGRLYTWEAAKKACPPGWRLPTIDEWMELARTFGGYTYRDDKSWKEMGDSSKAFHALIEGGSSGFNALIGGYRTPHDFYEYLGLTSFYWSNTVNYTHNDVKSVWGLGFNKNRFQVRHINGEIFKERENEWYGRSCRCIKDI